MICIFNKLPASRRDEMNPSLLLLRAMDFAARKHKDQRRKDEDASPYINHPVSVALLLADIGDVSDPEISCCSNTS